MKAIAFLATSLLITSAHAGVFMEVNRSSGLVPFEIAQSSTCKIIDNGVVNTVFSKQRVLDIDGSELLNSAGESILVDKVASNFAEVQFTAGVPDVVTALQFIANASSGQLQEKIAPTDIPSLSIVGIIDGDVVDQNVLIYNLGGSDVKNTATGSAELIEFAKVNCP